MTDYHAAEAALLRMSKALNMPPPPRVPAKAEEDDERKYKEKLALLITLALARKITREVFIERYTATVTAELEAVYRATFPGEVNPVNMAEAVTAQTFYIPRLADDLYSDKYPPREPEPDEVEPPKTRPLLLLAFLFGLGILARLNLWANGRQRVRNIARTHDPADPLLVWRLGATEEHCRDCLEANGRVLHASEWRTLANVGIHPQSPSLECGGWNCDCSLVKHDDD